MGRGLLVFGLICGLTSTALAGGVCCTDGSTLYVFSKGTKPPKSGKTAPVVGFVRTSAGVAWPMSGAVVGRGEGLARWGVTVHRMFSSDRNEALVSGRSATPCANYGVDTNGDELQDVTRTLTPIDCSTIPPLM